MDKLILACDMLVRLIEIDVWNFYRLEYDR